MSGTSASSARTPGSNTVNDVALGDRSYLGGEFELTALMTVALEIPSRCAIRAFGTPSAAGLLISAQSSKVITAQSLSAHFSPPRLFSFRAPPTALARHGPPGAFVDLDRDLSGSERQVQLAVVDHQPERKLDQKVDGHEQGRPIARVAVTSAIMRRPWGFPEIRGRGTPASVASTAALCQQEGKNRGP